MIPNLELNLTKIPVIDLSSNQFEGSIPSFLSEIPFSMGSLASMDNLVLRNNSLSGQLPSSLKNFSNKLALLDLGENKFHGPLPSWIGDSLQNLEILSLRSNNFYGSLPSNLCYLTKLQVLDLSLNNISGRIPTCVDQDFKNADKFLKTIDLSSNHLTEFLDLSRNHLSGKIPSSLAHIDRLTMLNFSNNELYGEIPIGTQLQTFNASSFEGNSNLCGEPLDRKCPEEEPEKPQLPTTDAVNVPNRISYRIM
ncbi:leucine-rich receptor-like kinase family protein [Medicago truncatula]|uniref:Leucine-rich receptor-like kinase family protein n=1 Tax=Medicago truncatula TaxID=3880 RepID=G7ID25_MEDTR|nr:leucine-rich receptor-like kinase family protein [Medicago truncatula]